MRLQRHKRPVARRAAFRVPIASLLAFVAIGAALYSSHGVRQNAHLTHLVKIGYATDCVAGTYFSGDVCVSADAGYFVATDAATAESACGSGTYSTGGAKACTPADFGHYVPSAPYPFTAQLACQAGTYAPTPGLTACITAPAGTYVPGNAADTAIACPVGTFAATRGQSSCTSAPAGNYVPGQQATSATPCPAGSYTAATGAAACTPAPAGSFVASQGATGTTPCATDTFTSNTESTSCQPCPQGFTTKGQTGQSSCTAIPTPKLVSGAAPSISGTATQGKTLTESHAAWSNSPTSYAYQWRRCNANGGGCSDIDGATDQTYTLTAAAVGHTIVVQETASNAGGDSAPATSPASAAVLAPVSTATTSGCPAGSTASIPGCAKVVAQINQIRKSASQIDKSYKEIAASAKSILTKVKAAATRNQANSLLSKADDLATKERALLKQASTEPNVYNQRTLVAKAREDIAIARQDAAQARVIAAIAVTTSG